VLDPLVLANLIVLDFPITESSTGFRAFLALLQRSADTLTELTIRGHYVTHDEVESIISTFSPHMRLRVLIINVRTLSLRLLDLLATQLPFLAKLFLYTHNQWLDGIAEDHEEGNMVPPIIRLC
jgi:hypothetical protein